MFRRFASGTAVASMAIALVVLFALLIPPLTPQRVYPMMVMWCFAPAVWGLWAMLAPPAWMPHRLPIWGAILGLIAGLLAGFILNLPLRFFGVAAPIIWRAVGAVVIAVIYYFLWMLVRLAYRSLGTPASVP